MDQSLGTTQAAATETIEFANGRRAVLVVAGRPRRIEAIIEALGIPVPLPVLVAIGGADSMDA